MTIILNNQVSDNQDIILILIISGSNLFILNYGLPNQLFLKKTIIGSHQFLTHNWFNLTFIHQCICNLIQMSSNRYYQSKQ
jgi:hypothetical protein